MSRYSTLMRRVSKNYAGKAYLCRLKAKHDAFYHPCDAVNMQAFELYVSCKACPFDTRIELSKFKEKICHASRL